MKNNKQLLIKGDNSSIIWKPIKFIEKITTVNLMSNSYKFKFDIKLNVVL